jgi:uncharacterized membrane protein
VYLGLLGVDFTVTEPPELAEHLRELAARYRRATDPAAGSRDYPSPPPGDSRERASSRQASELFRTLRAYPLGIGATARGRRGMGGAHGHGPGVAVSRRTRTAVIAVICPLVIATAVAMAVLWPHGSVTATTPQQPVRLNGTAVAVQAAPCQRPSARQCGTVTVRLVDGRVVTARIPEGPGSPVVSVGDRIVVVQNGEPSGAASYAVLDHQRGRQMLVLVALFALVIVAFGRWQGVRALAGLAASFAILLTFILPAIVGGRPPLLVAIVGSAAIMFVVLYLTHGPNVETSVAVLGTLVSLVLTGLLGAVATTAMHLTGFGSEESSLLSVYLGGIDPRGLLLASIIIGTLGVLDDVTVTQAATVSELAVANPSMRAAGLYRAATRVGRAHIASTVNTIVLAYAGASLPLLLLVVISGQPASTVLTSEFLAQEVVRSVTGTIGLVAAVPVTTGLAAIVSATTSGFPDPVSMTASHRAAPASAELLDAAERPPRFDA